MVFMTERRDETIRVCMCSNDDNNNNGATTFTRSPTCARILTIHCIFYYNYNFVRVTLSVYVWQDATEYICTVRSIPKGIITRIMMMMTLIILLQVCDRHINTIIAYLSHVCIFRFLVFVC